MAGRVRRGTGRVRSKNGRVRIGTRGDLHAPFERSFCGAIVVRVRNSEYPRPLEHIFGRQFGWVSVSVPGDERAENTTTTTTPTATAVTTTTVEVEAEAATSADKVITGEQPPPGTSPPKDWRNDFCRSPDFSAFRDLRNPVLLLLIDVGARGYGAKSAEAAGLAAIEIGYCMAS